MDEKEHILELAADLVAAYVSNNQLDADALPELIETVYRSMVKLAGDEDDSNAEKLVPAVPIEDSITDDYIICLEDGQKYKSLKRHLRTKFELTPKAYREKWGLPVDYPMVAPNYSVERSRLAKRTGLGKS
ncbi:MAG: transcriptional regulator [Acidimicrobiales bacterium]|nr:transcriptional regulator [Hyphomonadaceae bacterium]RZV41339.1 MAG: transcriptional regulator [Acidimicrobiales bacterium]